MDEPSPEAERRLTFVLLYGPVVQFARQQGAAEPVGRRDAAAQLPLSVDTVFQHPADAAVPDNLAHFCFCPLLKLHGVSELSFCLTDSSGAELHGVSLQWPARAQPDGGAGRRGAGAAAARPVALCMLGGRPLLEGMRHVLRALFQREVHRLPSEKTVKELSVRAGYDANGMGLVMGDRNIIMQVELGRTAARERRLRPGDVVHEAQRRVARGSPPLGIAQAAGREGCRRRGRRHRRGRGRRRRRARREPGGARAGGARALGARGGDALARGLGAHQLW